MKKFEVYDKSSKQKYILSSVFRNSDGVTHSKGFGWRIDVLEDDGIITELTWNLDFKSKLLNWLINVWPPRGYIKDFFLEKEGLKISFEEYLSDEKNIYPFLLDKESEWLAKFDFSKEKWNLERIKFLEVP